MPVETRHRQHKTIWPFLLFIFPLLFPPFLTVMQRDRRLVEADYLAERIKEVYEEVRPAASVSAEGLKEWQSFLGKDEDDTYKDDHLFIIIQEKENEVRLWIQITFLERDINNPRKQTAVGAKQIEASVDPKTKAVLISHNEFSPTEIETIFPQILRSIRDKKKLLGIKFF